MPLTRRPARPPADAVPALWLDRARRGARLLDRHMLSWADHVDLDALDMGDVRRDVLAQVLGCYADALCVLLGREATPEDRQAFGLTILGAMTPQRRVENGHVIRQLADPRWASLTAAWAVAIHERRGR